MIRFSAALVVVAIGILIGGVATSKLLLVYVAIGVSAVALVTLAIGVVLKREELFGEQQAHARAGIGEVAADRPALAGQASVQPQPQLGWAGDAVGARVPAAAPAHGGAGADPASRGDRAERRPGQQAFGQPSFAEAGGSGRSSQDQAARHPGGHQPPPFGAPRTDAPPPPPSAPSRSAPSRSAPPSAPRPSAPRPSAPPPSVPSAGRPAAVDLPPGARLAGKDAAPPRNRPPGHADQGRADGPWTITPPAAPAAPASAAPVPPAPPSAQDRRSTPSWFAPSSRPRRDAADEAAKAPEPEPASAQAPKATEVPEVTQTPDAPEPPQPAATHEDPLTASEAESATTSDGADAPASHDLSDEEDDWQPSRSWLDDDEPAESTRSWPHDDAEAEEPSATSAVATGASAAYADVPGGHDATLEDDTPAKAGTGSAVGQLDSDEADSGEADSGEADSGEADAQAPASAKNKAASADEASADEASTDEPGADDVATPDARAKHVTVVPGVPRYHRAKCILIRFMGDDDLQKMTVSEAAEAGCTPCRACQPDSDAD